MKGTHSTWNLEFTPPTLVHVVQRVLMNGTFPSVFDAAAPITFSTMLHLCPLVLFIVSQCSFLAPQSLYRLNSERLYATAGHEAGSDNVLTTPTRSSFFPSTEILPPFDASLYKAGAIVRRSSGSILIDVENVRGKSGFALTHAQLIQGLIRWSRVCQLQGRLSLVIDHGSEASALYLDDAQLSILFAGPNRKADDVIAQDVRFLGQELDVIVVTADGGIIDRCRRSAVQQGIRIVSPLHLLEDLELIAERTQVLEVVETKDEIVNLHQGDESEHSTAEALQLEQDLEYEIRVGAELLEAEALVRSKLSIQNRKRKAKLQAKIRKLREKLAKTSAVLRCCTDVLANGRQASSLGGLSQQDQNRLLQRWEKIRQKSNRKEKTGDRVVLAEHLRRQLVDIYGKATWNLTQTNTTVSSCNQAIAHVRKVHAKVPLNVHSLLPTSSRLRLVVISDTHGFETALTPDGQLLPPGDILLHLGDFAVDAGPRKKASLKAFDQWLARQPHPTKFVVRGNHDPRSMFFAESGATYITRPTTLAIAGLVFSFCPHVSGGMSNRMAPRRCDILCSHVPPKHILDTCFSGKHAGSATLRKAAEKMKTGPPVLWLCGHIHESRGACRHSFVPDRETLVINAANANSGMAHSIEHAPVVLEISQEKSMDKEEGDHACSIRRIRRRRHGDVNVTILSMENAFKYANGRDTGFFAKETTNDVRGMLVAVDLGFRTGLALYSEHGHLLEYEHAIYESIEDLEAGCLKMIAEWESKYQHYNSEQYHITKVAIEGADVALRGLWKYIAEDILHCPLLLVKPEEWRADLLLAKERASGEAAKEASRLIARQLVAEYGGRLHKGKFPTDVAEAVLLGYHVSRRLEWIPRKEPGVRRYSNGSVIVPKTLQPIL